MRLLNLANFPQVTAVNDPDADLGAKPGPVIVTNCAQINLVWGLADGKTAHNVLYGRYIGTFGGSTVQANGILTGLTTGAQWTALAAFLATTAGLVQVTIRDVNVRDQPIINSTSSGAFGVSASPELPDETAAALTIRTALTGRGNRGRAYIPGFATNALATGNVIAPAVVTALTNWGGTFAGIFTANGYTFVLGQKERLAYTSPITGVPHPARPSGGLSVQSFTCRDNHWDTQRRRGLK